MRRKVAVDSGPLVALFDRADEYHSRAIEFLKRSKSKLISNLAVVTEVTYLLDFEVKAQVDFLNWIRAGAVTLTEITAEDLDRVVELLAKYSDLPADFADVSLVAICERMGILEVATLDRDFSVYRLKGKKALKNVFPK